MANQKNIKNKKPTSQNKITKTTKQTTSKMDKNTLIMKVLVVLGVIILFIAILYLMNYFFIEKNYIKINMSTDRQLVHIDVNGEEELITTQKYVSDLNYSMRYDTKNFSVFKYKSQDIFKYIDAEKILVVVEKAKLPSSCVETNDNEYTNCVVAIDNYTKEQYISTQGQTYKITVKTPNNTDDGVESRIDYMINSFEINNK